MHAANTPITRRPARSPAWKTLDAAARRALDIIASAVGLLLLAPVFAILAIAIKRDSPGPVFYRGRRMGRGGQVFGIYKFRTMYERPDSYQGPKITAAGDARITSLGRWLRDTKLNELPQLWNVLLGHMSLVGPRPEDPEIARDWPADLRAELLSVRPGITSPATIIFRREEQLLSAAGGSTGLMDEYLRSILPDKLRLDLRYVRNRSLLTDLDVIFMTLVLLLPSIRTHEVPRTLLYWGPLAQFVSRHLTWFLIDTLVACAAVALAGLVWRLEGPLYLGPGPALLVALAVGLCFSITNALLGLNRIAWRRAPAAFLFPLALSTALAGLLAILFSEMVINHGLLVPGRAYLPVNLLVLAGVLAFLGFTALRYRERLLTGFAVSWLNARGSARALGERVLLIGAGENSQFATWLFTRSELSHAFSILGIVDDDPRKQGMVYDGFRVLGATQDLPALVEKHDVGLLVFTITNIAEDERRRILRLCRSLPVNLVLLPDLMAEVRAHFQFAGRPVPQTGFTSTE